MIGVHGSIGSDQKLVEFHWRTFAQCMYKIQVESVNEKAELLYMSYDWFETTKDSELVT